MENLIKLRTTLRSNFTKAAIKVEESLRTKPVDIEEIEIHFSLLSDKHKNLQAVDNDIISLLSKDPKIEQRVYDEEYEKMTTYSDRFITLKTKFERIQKGFDKINSFDNSCTESVNKKTVKLPKLELEKYDGSIKNWLKFWSIFRKIHEDKYLSDEDKFVYLIQSTAEKSRARDLVESFPPTAENYPLVIDCMKSRFGRDEMLIEVYVRELLNLVLSHNKCNLVKLYDKIEAYLRALGTLGVTSDKYAAMLYPLVESCLSEDILRIWERYISSLLVKDKEKGEINKLTVLMEFLRSEVESEQRLAIARNTFDSGKESQRKSNKQYFSENKTDVPTAAGLLNTNSSYDKKCIFCAKGGHYSQECNKAKKMSIDEKREMAKRAGCCYLCLKRGHVAKQCFSKIKCFLCNKFHCIIMCPGTGNHHGLNDPNNKDKGEEVKHKNCALTNRSCMRQVLLQTLVVRLQGKTNDKCIRALCDSGSQNSYISKYAASTMGYESIGEETIVHSLFGGIENTEKHNKYLIHLIDLNDKYRCNFEVLDQSKICSEVSRMPYGSFVKEINKHKIFLSDMFRKNEDLLYEFSSSEIHLLIGADVLGKLYTGKMKQLESGLVCMETRLGWTISGKSKDIETNDSTKIVLSLHVNEAKITDLWRLDTLGILDPGERGTRAELELAAKEHFDRSITRDKEGRYEVNLPWIQGHPPLPSCKNVAEKRLKKCVESLKKSECLGAYEAVFKEWLEEEIIEEIEPSAETKSEHYLPHRAVLKQNSTTKVRPVFDGSARERNSPSINDCLEKGPNTVELIPAVINRFRLKKIGVIADIRKAFLQIGLSERDRPFLKFLWWNDGDSANLRTFQHRRVVFGLSCSPYLLGATIQYHLQNASEDLKNTAQKLAESFYVDNCVTSVDKKEELVKFIEESQFLLSSAKFDLRGWEHTPCCPDDECFPSADVKDVPVLGLTWNLNDDSLTVDLKEIPEYAPPWTKRKILSSVHKIFDPIGFTCPVTLEPKVLLQQCWKLNVTWDSELPDSITKQFEKWKKGLYNLKEIAIPRCLIIYPEMSGNLTLHVFCDSSKIAYATCIFLRCETQGSVSCQLVQARSRVAPMKTISIPRLELLACSIGARLAQSVKTDLRMANIPTFYWSDSGNALYWIKGKDNWAPFVFNRVKEILSLSDPENWNHVPGPLNPADLPSRGCNAEVLRRSRWWEGPAWLRNPREEWPKSESFPDFEIVNSERRKCVVSATNVENSFQKIYDHSSYEKILRVIAWIRRFVNNSRNRIENRISGILTSDEFNQAETLLLGIVQKEYFTGPEDKRLKSLQCIVDSNGILRVKTRILMREDSRNFRYPIVLPSDHHVVEKLIRSRHLNLGHAGVQILMCNLREDFWILKYRKTVRKVVGSCVRCKRFDYKPKPVPEAPLPENRVREACVFEITGMDFAGPLILRGNQKVWIVIYTCAIYRAVHLEVATALTTDNFLQTFRRFIARRGRPAIIYCDNGTNFTGAENILKNIDWSLVCQFSTAQKIDWKFIPPSAPWWGGWWERLIGIMKRILRKVLSRSSLNLEEMTTIICDTESIMNNRPLTYISDDVNDLAPLTPSMFLQELRESGIPDLDIIDSTSLNRRQTYRQKIKEDLRKRFRLEYLGQLRQSSKYAKNNEPIKVDDVVLVSSDNTKRLDWPMAKVIQVYPSKDGRIRLVKVKMKNGEFLRPVLRLIPLEVTEENDAAPTAEEDVQFMPTFKKDLCPADSSANRDTNLCPKPNSELKRSRYGRLLRRRSEFI